MNVGKIVCNRAVLAALVASCFSASMASAQITLTPSQVATAAATVVSQTEPLSADNASPVGLF